MARSVGEAAATGLESGFRLGMDVVNQRRQQEQQARNNERQDRLDQAQADQLERQNTRQDTSDSINAATQSNADIQRELATHQALGTQPTPERKAVLTAAVRNNQATISKARATYGGADLDALTQQYAQAQQKLADGSLDPASMSDTDFANTVVQGVKRPLGDFQRGEDGSPSPIEQAGQQVIQGVQSGDTKAAVAGLNFLQKPSIERIIGQPSPHGGKIVGAQIADLHLDPNSPKDDPHYIPMLKVWVNDGKERADSGDLAHPTITSDEAQGAPAGATGHYFAPVTEDRTSSPDAKVMRFSMKDGLDFIGHNLHLADLLNTPEAQQKLQGAYSNPGQTPDDYLNATLGIMPAKRTVTRTVIPAGASVLEEATGPTGEVSSSRVVQGNSKPQTLVQKAEQAAQENGTEFADEYAKLRAANKGGETKDDAIARIEADPSLSAAEKKAAKLAVMSGIKPGKYTGSGLGGGGGGKPGDSLAERKQKAIELRDQNKADSTDESNARADLAAFDKRIENASGAVRRDPTTAAERKRLAGRLQAITDRIDARKAQADSLDAVPDPTANPGLPPPKPTGKPGGLTRDAAAKKFGF